jgi:hypothetical protein
MSPRPAAKIASRDQPDESSSEPVAVPMPVDIRSASLTILVVLAFIMFLRWAEAMIIPIVLGVLLSYPLEGRTASGRRAPPAPGSRTRAARPGLGHRTGAGGGRRTRKGGKWYSEAAAPTVRRPARQGRARSLPGERLPDVGFSQHRHGDGTRSRFRSSRKSISRSSGSSSSR